MQKNTDFHKLDTELLQNFYKGPGYPDPLSFIQRTSAAPHQRHPQTLVGANSRPCLSSDRAKVARKGNNNDIHGKISKDAIRSTRSKC